jgi:hypothetical protein
LCWCTIIFDHIFNIAAMLFSQIPSSEKVCFVEQHLKCVPGLKDKDYKQRLQTMNIPSMSYRRLRRDLIETCKFTHGLYNCASPLELCTQTVTRGHQYKLVKPYSRTNLRQHFFANRVVETWNSLDKDTVNASTLNSFKNRIDIIFSDHMFCTKVSHPVKPPQSALPPEEEPVYE